MYLIASVLLLIAGIFVIRAIWGGDEPIFSEDEIEMMTDYNSPLFTEISREDLLGSWPEAAERFDINNEKYRNSEQSFYKLDYKGLKELHFKTTGLNGNCSVMAINLNRWMNTKMTDSNYTSTDFSFVLVQDNGEPVSDIEVDDGDQEVGVINSCQGDPCSSCRFRRGIFSGEIIGCRCSNIGGHCNHSIQEG